MIRNPAQADRGIRFEYELMTSELAYIVIEIDLTDAVSAIIFTGVRTWPSPTTLWRNRSRGQTLTERMYS